MITLYVTHYNNFVMGDELFAPIGILKRNREEFSEQTENNSFVVDEEIYQLLCKNKHTEYDNRMVIASENLLKRHKGATDHDWDVYIDNIPITSGYLHAVPKALEKNRDVTILCGPDMIQQAIRNARNIDRLIQVEVCTKGARGPLFPDITSYFRLAYQKHWPKDSQNPCDATFRVYLKNMS